MIKKLIFFFSIYVSTYVHSFEFTNDFNQGYYWQSLPIRMNLYVDTFSVSPINLTDIVNQSVYEWENIVGQDIWDIQPVVGAPGGSYIRWSSDFGQETGFDPNTTLAITIRHRSGTHLVKTEVILNGNNNSLINDVGGTLKKTVLHELGHTIGIGHSKIHPSIMFESITHVGTLQEDDKQALEAVVSTTLDRQLTGFVAPSSQGGGIVTSSSSFGGGCTPGSQIFEINAMQLKVNKYYWVFSIVSSLFMALFILLPIKLFYRRR